MRWSGGSLLELEADLRRTALEQAARAHAHPARTPVRRPAPAGSWRVWAGRRLMRLGARLAALDAAEHAPPPRHPRPGPTA